MQGTILHSNLRGLPPPMFVEVAAPASVRTGIAFGVWFHSYDVYALQILAVINAYRYIASSDFDHIFRH
jgi:hypothetical protein